MNAGLKQDYALQAVT